MNEFAALPADERRDILNEAAVRLGGVDVTIPEKDFWVCWMLRALFELGPDHPSMVFKGGTSLSKAYGLIERFSEDIDMVTSADFFTKNGAPDPETSTSRSNFERRVKLLDEACARYVAESLRPELRAYAATQLGESRGWEFEVDPDDPHTLLFRYPSVQPEHSYIRGRVKIELGWRSATTPTASRSVRPYVADVFPGIVERPDVTCRVLSAGRTFWEKVTALHAESFRDEVPRFFSRHYSDVAVISGGRLGPLVVNDVEMLETVRTYKSRYYSSAWARYDLAIPGTLRLVPPPQKLRRLALDYREMRPMFFSEPLAFQEIVNRLRALEDTINSVRTPAPM
jgi:hypothetical protein